MTFKPEGHFMYRVEDKSKEKTAIFSPFNPNAEENCREWQKFSSPDIPLADIYAVVYKMSLADFENFYRELWDLSYVPNTPYSDNKKYSGDNAFLLWLSRNSMEAAQFLLFAKITEDVRGRHNSRWYYPSMKMGGSMSLEEIAEKALNYQGPLRDRYLLQAVRTLFSLRRYEDCVTLWNEEASLLPKESIMRRMILSYVAGAEYRMDHYDKAVAYFYEAGDIVSMIACSTKGKNKSTVETIERLYKVAPDGSFFPGILQKFIRSTEGERKVSWNDEKRNVVTNEHRRLAQLSIRIAQEGKNTNPAMWYYTAAFIEDLDGHTAQAYNLLAKAERSHGTAFIKESIKVFRIYLDAKVLPYDQFYENRLFTQLQWLDQKIVENLTPEVRARTSEIWAFRRNLSYYYWNDVMRRITLTEVCPRMLAAGKTVRALQLANMADNRLLDLVNRITNYGWIDDGWEEKTGTMQDFRRNSASSLDYSNYFFEMIDSLDVNKAIEYRRRIEQPLNAFDRFLNQRSYASLDYVDDIIGTKYLRAMRYKEAVSYLGRVSRSFEGHLHTELEWDPFSYDRKIPENKTDFKYRFAREMYMLEQEMNNSANVNRRAEAMFRYAIGLRSSFGKCWGLTQYYLGREFYGQVQEKRDWSKDPQTVRAIERSSELLQKACSLFQDPELAAQSLQKLHQYLTLVKKYPQTATSHYVRGHCDNLVDYAINW